MISSSRPTSIVVILTAIWSSSFVVQAVPAIVWKKLSSSSQHLDKTTTTTSNHVSKEISFSNFVESSLLTNKDDYDKWNVIFLMNRNIQTGQESMTSMTPSLQQTLQLSLQQEQEQQPIQYMHVSGIESGIQVVNTIQRTVSTTSLDEQTTTSSLPAAVLINLNELSYKLNSTASSSSLNDDTASVGMDGITNVVVAPSTTTTSTMASAHTKATMKLSKRYRMIDQANWFIVTVPYTIDPNVLDTILVQTIQHEQIQNVVLSGIRSVEEVKYERMLQMRRTLFSKTTIVGSASLSTGSTSNNKYHRRLQEEENAQDGDDSNDLSGIYYVQMTPNILAGLLFFAMFFVVALIGFSCMNMIAGQDVYVNVMPSIGREA